MPITIEGGFGPDAADWHYLPVEVPPGVREIAVRHHHDRPTPPPGLPGNACDIGIFAPDGFRGWSGGARTSFAISASDATPGYLAGPITPGTWQLVLGPYTVAPQGMRYRVEVTLTPGPAGPPSRPDPAPATAPARARGPAEYRGDCHLHTVYSDGTRTQAELVADARAAGLDFIVSTEHNSPSGSLRWGAAATDDLLIINGLEVTTRTGHWPALHLPPGHWIDWRYRSDQPERFAAGAAEVRRLGGLVTAAHPFDECPGCAWQFGYDHVDLIEVWNGPWRPANEAALTCWDGLLREGRRIPAVGGSDAHRPEQPVGLPQNVVFAADLRADALLAGLRAGRSWIAESAVVRLALTAGDGTRTVGLGECLRTGAGTPVTVRADVAGVPGTEVRLVSQLGLRHAERVPDSGSATVTCTVLPRYTDWIRAEVRRQNGIVALSNPLYLGSASV